MVRASLTPAVAADAAAVTSRHGARDLVLRSDHVLAGRSGERVVVLDLEQNARVVRDGGRIVGYGVLRELGALWRTEGYVHPDAHGRGIGRLIATGLEEGRRSVARAGSRTASSRSICRPRAARVARLRRRAHLPRDAHRARSAAARAAVARRAARRLLRPGARRARVPRRRPGGVQRSLGPHAARLRGLGKSHLQSERFDPSLWCVVRAGDEIAAGTICTGETYGGGWVEALGGGVGEGGAAA